MKFTKKGIAFLLAFCFALVLLAPLSGVNAAYNGESDTLSEKTASVLTITENPTQPIEADYVVFFNHGYKGMSETTYEGEIDANAEFAYRTLENGATQSPYHPKTLNEDTLGSFTPKQNTKFNDDVFVPGDKKVFTLLNADGNGSILPVEFEVLAVGENCYVWRPADSSFSYRIETSHAEILRDEFEKNYDAMESAFGELNYPESGNGKVNLMVYDILCGYDPSQGVTSFTGGFFWPNDFHPGVVQGYTMNGEAMIHIDTYPQIFNKQGTGVPAQSYATIVHEFQHLINYSRTMSNPYEAIRMELWLNECMAMSAEEMIYPGTTIYWRISDWRNFGASFWNYGRAINNWDTSSAGILGSYALAALYGQYLKLQTGDYAIFSHILDYYQSAEKPTANQAIQSGAEGTVFDGMSASEINASFRIALNFKSAFGLYGFHDDNAFTTLMPMLSTRPTISAAVGGAVTIKPTDGIYDPSLYNTSDSFVAYCIKYENVEMSNTLFGFSGDDWVTINPDDGKVENRLATAFSGKKVVASEIFNDYVYGFTNDKAFIMHHLDMQPTFFDKSVEVYDMSYDYSSNTMFALGKVGTSKHGLYSMNLENCQLTLVKEINSTGTPVAIAFDSNGKLYALTSESGNGVLCEINKSTGKTTKIGNTEKTITYSQSLNYDHDNGILYLASSTEQGKGFLAILNTDNGFAFTIRSNIGEVYGLYSIPTYINNPSARYLSYRITDGSATITNCSKNAEGVITIPNTLQGYPVTSIASSAFSGCSAITEVKIPESVKTIGASTFAACVGLKSIDIPKSVAAIDNSAFADCVNLTEINIDANNPNFTTHLGSVYNKSRTTLLICPAGFTGEFTVASETTAIGTSAFKNCMKITKITLAVQTIEANAFFNCKGLVELELLNGLKTIGDSAFRNCNSLESIVVPDSVTTIGANAFRDCSSVTSVTLPENLTKISDYLFTNCTSLQSIELPNALEEIGAYAFNKCTSMQTIEIPENVTTIKNYAFNASSLLRGAQFLGDAPKSFGTKVFDGCSTSFTIYYNAQNSGWTSPTWNGYKTSTDEMPTYILGDANCDNLVNTGDAVLILKHAAGLTTLQGNSFYAADINLDGKVNTGDATLILVKCVA